MNPLHRPLVRAPGAAWVYSVAEPLRTVAVWTDGRIQNLDEPPAALQVWDAVREEWRSVYDAFGNDMKHCVRGDRLFAAARTDRCIRGSDKCSVEIDLGTLEGHRVPLTKCKVR